MFFKDRYRQTAQLLFPFCGSSQPYMLILGQSTLFFAASVFFPKSIGCDSSLFHRSGSDRIYILFRRLSILFSTHSSKDLRPARPASPLSRKGRDIYHHTRFTSIPFFTKSILHRIHHFCKAPLAHLEDIFAAARYIEILIRDLFAIHFNTTLFDGTAPFTV